MTLVSDGQLFSTNRKSGITKHIEQFVKCEHPF